MTTPLTRKALEQAAFWGEGVCLSCGTVQTEAGIDEPCQECDSTETVPAAVALQFIDNLEDDDV